MLDRCQYPIIENTYRAQYLYRILSTYLPAFLLSLYNSFIALLKATLVFARVHAQNRDRY
jgi:hypothetical protein